MIANQITTGRVFVEATTTQKQQDEVKASNKKIDERARKIEAELAAQKKARDAALKLHAPDCRFPTLLLGTTRLEAKFRRTGDTAKADGLKKLADEMAAALETYRAAKTAEAKPVPTPLADAVSAAAKELKKALPACFPSLADAEFFAGRNLSLTAARTAQTHADDAHGKLAKAVQKAASAFWDLTEKAARVAIGFSDDNAVRQLEAVGSI